MYKFLFWFNNIMLKLNTFLYRNAMLIDGYLSYLPAFWDVVK